MSTASRTAWVAVPEPSVPTTIELNMTPPFAGGAAAAGGRWGGIISAGGRQRPRALASRAPRLCGDERRARADLFLGLVGTNGRAQVAAVGASLRRDRR